MLRANKGHQKLCESGSGHLSSTKIAAFFSSLDHIIGVPARSVYGKLDALAKTAVGSSKCIPGVNN
eukprot:6186276-Pleurochrysis_carterae.AAC.2